MKSHRSSAQFLGLALLVAGLGFAGGYIYLNAYHPTWVADLRAKFLGDATPEQTPPPATAGSGMTTAQLRTAWAEQALAEGRLKDADDNLKQAEELEPGSKTVQALRAKIQAAQDAKRQTEEAEREAKRRAEAERKAAEQRAREAARKAEAERHEREEAERRQREEMLTQQLWTAFRNHKVPGDHNQGCWNPEWYAKQAGYKALVMANYGITSGSWVCGVSVGRASQDAANAEALQSCEKRRSVGRLTASRCKLFAIGSEIVYKRE